jgi:hypothetical protein
MIEESREKLYWHISLVLFLTSLFALLKLVNAKLEFSFSLIFFLIFLYGSIFFPTLIEIIITLFAGKLARLRFFVKNPSVRVEHALKEDPGSCRDRVEKRILTLGCAPHEKVAEGLIEFHKDKKPQVINFLDHAFQGKVTFIESAYGTRIVADLTLSDTLIMDTGENKKIEALCDFISLKAEDFTLRTVPFTLFCSLSLAFMCQILLLFRLIGCPIPADVIFPAALGSLGMLLFAIPMLLRDRKHLFGARLILPNLYFCLLPFIPVLMSHLHPKQ